MKRILSVIALCLVITGCPPPGSGKPNVPMLCEEATGIICTDGSSPEACVAFDLSVCGFEVKGRWYQCDFCDLEGMGCDSAIEDSLNACQSGDGGLLMEEENPEFDYMVDEMQAHMAELKVLVY